MPIVKIEFKPGLNREVTNYANTGGFYDANNVRFRTGNPEKIGGWTAFDIDFNGVARTLWYWRTSTGYSLIAMGTNQKYYIEAGGAGGTFYDITPTTTRASAITFATTNGSNLVTVLDNTAVTLGTFVNFPSTTVGGLTISGLYEIISFPTLATLATTATSGAAGTATVSFAAQAFAVPAGSTVTVSGVTPTGYNGTYTVTASTTSSVSFVNATTGAQTIAGTIQFAIAGYQILASANATSTAVGGSSIPTYDLNAGNAVASPSGNGWGVPPYGTGGWGGGGASAAIPLRLWSQANFGDNLVFAQNNGGLYYWEFNTSYPDALPMGGISTVTTAPTQKTKTVQTVVNAVTASTTFVVANSQGIDYGALVTGSGVSAGTYVSKSPDYTGSVTVTVTNAVTLTAGQQVTFSYSGQTAPTQVGSVIVSTTNQFVVALGSTPYNPATFTQSFSPMLVRWSDQSLPYEWTPATYNQSGEQSLSLGSYIVCGLSTRQENLIWTDRALYSMQYVGAPFVFSFNLMMDNISIISPNAMISVGGATYWMGADKFYLYNGTVVPLPCSVRHYVFNYINQSQVSQIICGQNEQYNEIWWFYPSTSSLVNDSYVIYNYIDSTWYYGSMNRTAWLQTSLQMFPLAVYSVQNSYLSSSLGPTDPSISLLTAASYPSSGTVQIGTELISYTSVSTTSLSGLTRGVIPSATTTATSGSGSSATVTFALQSYAPPVGSTIVISGVTPSGYNGTFTVTSSTTTSATFASTTTGSQTVAGTIQFSYVAYTPVQSYTYNQILSHENGVDDASANVKNTTGSPPAPVTSYLQTSDFDINGGDHFGYVWRFLPDFTFEGSTSGTTPQIFLTLNPRNNSGVAYMTGGDIGNVADSTVTNTQPAPLPPNTTPVEQYTGAIYTRIRGRQMNFRIQSTGVGVTWQMGVMRFDVRPDGRR